MTSLERLKVLAEAATPGPWQWMDPQTDEHCLPDTPCSNPEHDSHAYNFSLRTVEEFPSTSGMDWTLPKFIIHSVEEFHEVQGEDGAWTHPDAEFIEACSPDVVLDIISQIAPPAPDAFTEDEANVIVAALHNYRFETDQYIRGGGFQPCAPDCPHCAPRVAHFKTVQDALEVRRAAIISALNVFKAGPCDCGLRKGEHWVGDHK